MKILLFGASGLFGINFIYKFSKEHEIIAVLHKNLLDIPDEQTIYWYLIKKGTNVIQKKGYGVISDQEISEIKELVIKVDQIAKDIVMLIIKPSIIDNFCAFFNIFCCIKTSTFIIYFRFLNSI